MSTNRLYDSLLSLPLFLGMTCYDFQNVAGKTRFDFQKLEAGETIVEEGTSCTRLYYLISGDIKVITQADDYGCQVEDFGTGIIPAGTTFRSYPAFHPHLCGKEQLQHHVSQQARDHEVIR